MSFCLKFFIKKINIKKRSLGSRTDIWIVFVKVVSIKDKISKEKFIL